MNRQTLAQQRASHALECIRKREKETKEKYGNYVSYVESLPAAILMNGLGQAAATLLAKAGGELSEPHGKVYEDLQSWLCRNDHSAPYPTSSPPSGDALMVAIVKKDAAAYLRAQTEALAYLVWLKKFARAFLQKGENP